MRPGGKLKVYLFRYGENDIAPIDIKTQTVAVPDGHLLALRKKLNLLPHEPVKIGQLTILDIKGELTDKLKTLTFTPLQSQMKNHYLQVGRQIGLKRDSRTWMEKHSNVMIFGGAAMMIIVLVYFYFHYASELASRSVECNIEAIKAAVSGATQAAQTAAAEAPPVESVAPNPFSGLFS